MTRWRGLPPALRGSGRRATDSCGFGVPLLCFQGERDTLGRWTDKKGEDGLAAHVREKNATSIDGLPGLVPG
ncbi:MAG TPA: hypothetical protein VFT55_13280 [Planctomycetota bacterium]|nr:hypothetical protein [Planctomycetota bacterium]